MDSFDVLFQPDGLRITVERGTLLTEAMSAAGIAIQLPCAGTGKCGKCVVEIHPDPPDPNGFDIQHITEADLALGKRLACQVRVDRPMSVLVGQGIRVLDGKILVDGEERVFDLAPVVTKRYVELPGPTLEDQRADLRRLKDALSVDGDQCPPFDIDLGRRLCDIMRAADFKVTATFHDDRLVNVEPGDTTGRLYGIAFDLGTTTVVGTILDLVTGAEVSRASRLNAQVVYGEDTISRIKYAIESDRGRHDMEAKIKGVVNEIIAEAAESAAIDAVDIYEAVFVGNTTMSHLFLGLSPEGLSRIPFVPVTNAPVNLRARDTGIGINPLGNVHVLPNIAGFVGSDTVGVMLATGFLDEGPVQLAVDVGTNGELALRHNGGLIVCSTAAGPALEGAALTCGMRAAAGAIEHVSIAPDGMVEYDVIGDAKPAGLCGSGIIDVVAELLEAGFVDVTGRIPDREELESVAAARLLDHYRLVNGEPAFVVTAGRTAPGDKDVVITQRDIRQIQLAKGAISAGIAMILKSAGLSEDDIDELLLAGAFGNYIRKTSAQRIGLLPAIPPERIRFVGNAASTGAKMALLSAAARRDADRIRHRTGHLELAASPEFQNEYMNAMLFP